MFRTEFVVVFKIFHTKFHIPSSS